MLSDVTCVIHVHSTHSDGTGSIAQIATAAERSGVDAVLLSDHDTLAGQAEEGWHSSALVLVGEEISPPGRDHTLAFGAGEHVRHRNRTPAEICAAVKAGGGVAFAAHPFSHGSPAFERFGRGTPYGDLDAPALTGLELWSFVVDSAERLTGASEAVRFLLAPQTIVDHPPAANMQAWDRICARRRLVAIGGIDAHQIGVRVRGRVPLRLMGYARSFSHLRTHVLCDQPLSGDLDADRQAILGALSAGRCYIAMDSLAPARGFSFRAGGDGEVVEMGSEAAAGDWTLRASVPRPAELRLLAGGSEIASTSGALLEHRVTKPGAYRVEARLEARGRQRTWILSNPIYLR
ncbi:MAG: CehA/McbA family metallohydrolase [Thermoleophilaceae bacterium]